MGDDRYITLTREELAAVAIESRRTIDIDQFVPSREIDELYVADPYYIVPEGEVGQQAFAVIRDAIAKEGMVALGRVVLSTREHVIANRPRGKGLFATTLRYPYEVRKEADSCSTSRPTSSTPSRGISRRRNSRTATSRPRSS